MFHFALGFDAFFLNRLVLLSLLVEGCLQRFFVDATQLFLGVDADADEAFQELSVVDHAGFLLLLFELRELVLVLSQYFILGLDHQTLEDVDHVVCSHELRHQFLLETESDKLSETQSVLQVIEVEDVVLLEVH